MYCRQQRNDINTDIYLLSNSNLFWHFRDLSSAEKEPHMIEWYDVCIGIEQHCIDIYNWNVSLMMVMQTNVNLCKLEIKTLGKIIYTISNFMWLTFNVRDSWFSNKWFNNCHY